MNLKYQFTDKNVVVTGGAQGIGMEITKSFLQAGATVAIWDYSEEALGVAKKELMPFADRTKFQTVDVSNFSSCDRAASELDYKVDVLVNNAGITRDKSFKKMDAETFDLVIRTNLSGVFNVTKALQDVYNDNSKHNRIINISSVVALYGNFGQVNYVAAKAGVIGMTKTLARELGKKGFTVNAIAPGFIQTAMVNKMPAETLAAMASKVPVAHLGTTEDVANAVLFLASEEAAYINGTTLSVDGGLVC